MMPTLSSLVEPEVVGKNQPVPKHNKTQQSAYRDQILCYVRRNVFQYDSVTWWRLKPPASRLFVEQFIQ